MGVPTAFNMEKGKSNSIERLNRESTPEELGVVRLPHNGRAGLRKNLTWPPDRIVGWLAHKGETRAR